MISRFGKINLEKKVCLMTKSIVKFLVVVCVFTMICGCDSGKKVDDAKSNLESVLSQNNYVVIDVRTKEEYDAGHVKGALNVPYDEIDESLDVEKDKTILVYCQSGRRSKIAYDDLRSLGYEVFDLGAYQDVDLEKE